MLFLILVVFLGGILNAQKGSIKKIDSLKTVEKLILHDEFDSVKKSFQNVLSIDNEYVQSLRNIVTNETSNNGDYLHFFTKISTDYSYSGLDLFELYQRRIAPSPTKFIDYDYVMISWLVIDRLRNESFLDIAGELNLSVEKYIMQFPQSDPNFQKSKILISSHEVVMKIIQQKVEDGMELISEYINTAWAIQDTNLIIMELYYKCDLLVIVGDLDNYIQTSRQCFELDHDRAIKSYFYYSNIIHLIDALVYKGDNFNEAYQLLLELYHSERKYDSYSLFIKMMSYLPRQSNLITEILQLFEVDNIKELCIQLSEESRPYLNDHDFFHVLNESRIALNEFGELELAYDFLDKAMFVNRDIYSKELSQQLANYETLKIEDQKNYELKLKDSELKAEQIKLTQSRKQLKYYIIFGVILSLLLFFTLALLYRLRKQKGSIENQRKELQESDKLKELLLKEVHHRVKNNFQVITSLLEMEARSANDEELSKVLKEVRNRISSMHFVHQKLYDSTNLSLSVFDLVKELKVENQKLFGVEKVEFDLDIDQSENINIDTAIPLGLILNEIITNAFKYGLSEDGSLTCSVRYESNGNNRLLIFKDSGQGLPESFDVAKSKSIGLRLIRSLAKQLSGRVEFFSDSGTNIKLSFSKN